MSSALLWSNVLQLYKCKLFHIFVYRSFLMMYNRIKEIYSPIRGEDYNLPSSPPSILFLFLHPPICFLYFLLFSSFPFFLSLTVHPLFIALTLFTPMNYLFFPHLIFSFLPPPLCSLSSLLPSAPFPFVMLSHISSINIIHPPSRTDITKLLLKITVISRKASTKGVRISKI